MFDTFPVLRQTGKSVTTDQNGFLAQRPVQFPLISSSTVAVPITGHGNREPQVRLARKHAFLAQPAQQTGNRRLPVNVLVLIRDENRPVILTQSGQARDQRTYRAPSPPGLLSLSVRAFSSSSES